jgi:hypothetical protein
MKKNIKITKKPSQDTMWRVSWKPQIKLSGNYLADFGFGIGSMVEVQMFHDKIIITNVSI